MSTVIILGAGIGMMLAGALLLETAVASWVIPLVLLVATVMDWMVLPGDSTRRAETPMFAFVVASVVIFNPLVAAGFAVYTVGTGEFFRPDNFRATSAVNRAVLAVGLVLAGFGTMMFPLVVPFLFLIWTGFIGYWAARHSSLGNHRAVRRHGYMLAWVVFMLAMPLWISALPANVADVIMEGVPALHVALGFMTADTALVTGIGIWTGGRSGLWFWLRELIPTFTRYNIMAVAGATLVAATLLTGFAGLSMAMTAFVVVFLLVREREHGHRRLVSTVCVLASALEARDSYTKGHADRVSSYSVALAERLGWSSAARRDLELAAHLHDIGKVGVRDDVLLKPGKFTDEDFEVMKTHSAIGAGIVQNSPEVRHVAPIVRQHHERLDGSGYPDGLAGSSILPAARIIGVADAYDAMTSNRPYRDAMGQQTALDIIQRGKGSEFDPDVVDALLELAEKEQLEAALQFGYCLTH